MTSRTGAVFATVATLFAVPAAAFAAGVAFDEPVSALTSGADGSIFAAGQFSTQQPLTGGGLRISADGNGAAEAGPPIAGTVYAVVADGNGGWFVGGDFERAGGANVRNLAHLDATGAADPAWAPDPDQPVRALALGGGTLFAGGDFLAPAAGRTPALRQSTRPAAPSAPGRRSPPAPSWRSPPRPRPSTWAAPLRSTCSPSTPSAAPRGTIGRAPRTTIYALALSGTTLYAGGGTVIGKSHLGALDVSSGLALPAFNPPQTSGSVRVLAVSGSTLYAGGQFTTLGGQSRNGLAALATTTGALSAWTPDLPADSTIDALAVAGTSLLAGGSVVAALDAAGTRLTWRPQPLGQVNALASNGTSVYIGGALTGVGSPIGQIAHLARVKPDGSLDTGFNPAPNGDVNSLALSGTTSTWWARSAASPVRRGPPPPPSTPARARWDPGRRTRTATSTRSRPPARPSSWAASSPTQGQPRGGIAAVAGDTGAVTAWSASAHRVRRLAITADRVYADIDSLAYDVVVAFDRTTGADTNWVAGGSRTPCRDRGRRQGRVRLRARDDPRV